MTTEPFLPYSKDSYFYSAPGPIDGKGTDEMRKFLKSHPDQKKTAYPLLNGCGGNQWGMVFREGNEGDPVWKLGGTVPKEVASLKTTGFHAPADLSQSITGTSDSPMVIRDRVSGISVWAAKVSKGSGNTLNVGAAGFFEHNSNGLDKRVSGSNSKVNFRSRGALPDAMVITEARADWAAENDTDLGHVLHIFWVETNSNAGHKFPMAGHESGQNGWGAEGQRISIDPSVDLTKRGLSRYGLVIARTLQRHGAYLGDNAGSGTALKLEQDQKAHPVWGSSITQNDLRGLTWDDFVANVS